MKNSNSESLEKKALSDKDLNSESFSEKTEDEIIYNNCISPEEEEFLETEDKVEQNIPEIKQEENNQIVNSRQQGKSLLKSLGNSSIPLEEHKSRKNKFHDYYSPKFDYFRKKHNKPEEVKTADDLFAQALQKNKALAPISKEYDQKGNTLSKKISNVIYNKCVGGNDLKKNTIDIDIFKMKDEELNIKKKELRKKDNQKKINDLITRQNDYIKYKKNNLIEKERILNEKINQDCIFMPNGNKNLTLSRTPKVFYASEMEFLVKKEDYINQGKKSKKEEEDKIKKVALLNKNSEKIASSKNPNESKEQLYERLHYEKLKNVKQNYERPREEKKMSKKQVNSLFDKLYKERISLKENKEKKEKEKILKDTNQEDYTSENSNKVLLNKFLNYYNQKLMEIFNRNDNFQINIDEYKLILISLGCVNPNLQSDEALIKESFFNILNPKDDKIDTHTLLLFCLAALGIYKGNDDLKSSVNIKPKFNPIPTNKLNRKKSPKQKSKTFNELIKINVPNLDMDKYGFSSKIAKNINKKFHTFVKGINESWTGDISKKKQERNEKLQSTQKKRQNSPSLSKNKSMKNSENVFNINLRSSQKSDYPNLKSNNKNSTIPINSSKFDDLYKRLQNKRDINVYNSLKNKKEQDELALCTFQPNMYKFSDNTNNSNEKIKNRAKLNKKQIDQNFEKLYQDGKAAYITKKKSIEPDADDNIENKIHCTFKPVIHQFNMEVFNKNPIKEDIEKFERIREQKMNDIRIKEYEKPMNFYIEPKINKEDIIDRVVPERFSHRMSDIDRDKEKGKENEAPLLKVEVNLDENNHTDKIIIYSGDDVKEKTLQFCLKHKLNEEKKNTLLHIIMEKLEETKSGEEKLEENKYKENTISEGGRLQIMKKIEDNKNFEEDNKNFEEDNNDEINETPIKKSED